MQKMTHLSAIEPHYALDRLPLLASFSRFLLLCTLHVCLIDAA